MRANKTEIAHLEISRSRFGIEASGGRVGPRSIHEFRGCRALAKAEKVAELKKKEDSVGRSGLSDPFPSSRLHHHYTKFSRAQRHLGDGDLSAADYPFSLPLFA